MGVTQAQKAEAFAALHVPGQPFVIGNVFDGLSARMLAGEGFEALATSSWVQAALLGRMDRRTSRETALAHARIIAEATHLPASADLENGLGDAPEDVAETIRQAAASGLVGCTIEDATGRAGAPIYDFAEAVTRIEAGVAAARALPFRFTLTARSENFRPGDHRPRRHDPALAGVRGRRGRRPDGARPARPHAMRRVCNSVSKPVNFMAGIPGRSFTADSLAEVGVARISIAQTLYTHAMAAAARAARETRSDGTFTYLDPSPSVDFGVLLKA